MFIYSICGIFELSFLYEYKENFVLITFFLIAFFTIQMLFFNDTISKEEKMNRQKLAEGYLNQHIEEDNEFFYGALKTANQSN